MIDLSQIGEVTSLFEKVYKKILKIRVSCHTYCETYFLCFYPKLISLEYRIQLIFTPVFTFVDSQVSRRATHEYKKGGDFADLLIVVQAKEHQARKLISFDKKLQKKFPDFVIEKLRKSDL